MASGHHPHASGLFRHVVERDPCCHGELRGLERGAVVRRVLVPVEGPAQLGRLVLHDVAPELERLRGMRVLCVYGKDEKESLCRLADTTVVRVDQRAGRHHFDGDYDAIASEILQLFAPVDASGRR